MFDKDELKKVQEAKEKGIILSGRNNLDKLKQNSSISTIDDKINSLAAQTIDDVSKALDEMKKAKAELVFVFDKSSSCFGTERATIKGFYDVINKEIQESYEDIVTVSLFGDKEELIYDRTPIDCLSRFSYCAYGNTALYDTLGSRITKIERRQKYDDIRPEKTLFVIMTDGYDNTSKRYTLSDINNLIVKQAEKGWKFLLMGNMINSKEAARNLGINPIYAEDYDTSQIHNNFEAVSRALEGIHKNGQVKLDWAKPITENKPKLSGGHVKKLGSGISHRLGSGH